MLGRIKNRLLAYGVTIYLSTPVTVRGLEFSPGPRTMTTSSPCICVRDDSRGAAAVVWFDVEQGDNIELVYKPEAEAEIQSEGELLLF